MNESEFQALIETSWRRPLTPDEQTRLDAWLATRPEARAAWETECGLNQVLSQLPDAPVASNFTSQVLLAVERETAPKERRPSLLDWAAQWFRRPAPRVAWALLLSGALWFGYERHQTNERGEMAQGLSVLANVTTL